MRDALSVRGRAGEEARMASEVDIAAVVGRRYWREAEARVVVEAWRASGESLAVCLLLIPSILSALNFRPA